MDRKHTLWVERGVKLGTLFAKCLSSGTRPGDVRPVVDFAADPRIVELAGLRHRRVKRDGRP